MNPHFAPLARALESAPAAHRPYLQACINGGGPLLADPEFVNAWCAFVARGDYRDSELFERFAATGELPTWAPSGDLEQLTQEGETFMRHVGAQKGTLPHDPHAGLMGQLWRDFGSPTLAQIAQQQKGNTMLNSPDTLTADESAVARAMGLSHEEFLANKRHGEGFKARQFAPSEPTPAPTAPTATATVALTPEDREVARQLGLTETQALANKQHAEELRAGGR